MTEDEFRELYDSLRNPVFLFAARRVGTEAANDVVSETFEVAWRKRADFPADDSSWVGWVIGIAKNKVLQELQRRGRKHHDQRFAEDWFESDREAKDEDIARAVVDSVVALRVYRELTPAEQQLFDIAFVQDLRPGDATTVLGISPSTFTSRVNRLRQRLRALEVAQTADKSSSVGGSML